MSQHFVNREDPPPGLSSFTKIRLGWISPEHALLVKPGDTRYTFLSPLAKKGETYVVKIPLTQGRYYLVENRQPVGYDRILPDSGILILKVDPEVQEGSGTVKIMNADQNSPYFSHATFRLDRDNRNVFVDEKSNVAVIPLWSEGENQGVLVTTPERSADALKAASAIQRLLSRYPEHREDEQEQVIERCIESFKRFDFESCCQNAKDFS